MSFLIGLGINLLGIIIYYLMQKSHVNKISDFPEQALTIVVKTTIIRFFLTGTLLILVFSKTDLIATTVLFGFVFGQILFIINQLRMVAKTDGK